MFGRVTAKKSYSEAKCYYMPGILDRVPYEQLKEGRIFVASVGNLDFDEIMVHCQSFDIGTATREDKFIKMLTGRERWAFKMNERGAKIANYRI